MLRDGNAPQSSKKEQRSQTVLRENVHVSFSSSGPSSASVENRHLFPRWKYFNPINFQCSGHFMICLGIILFSWWEPALLWGGTCNRGITGLQMDGAGRRPNPGSCWSQVQGVLSGACMRCGVGAEMDAVSKTVSHTELSHDFGFFVSRTLDFGTQTSFSISENQ